MCVFSDTFFASPHKNKRRHRETSTHTAPGDKQISQKVAFTEVLLGCVVLNLVSWMDEKDFIISLIAKFMLVQSCLRLASFSFS